jgi:hypothetical protein
MHTYCTLCTDVMDKNSVLCRPFPEIVHTSSRANAFPSIAAARPTGKGQLAHWPCHQGQRSRAGGAVAAAAGSYFPLGEVAAAGASPS